jgi:hypothetical protein
MLRIKQRDCFAQANFRYYFGMALLEAPGSAFDESARGSAQEY